MRNTITLLSTLTLAALSFSTEATVVTKSFTVTDKSLQLTSDPYWPRVYIKGVELDGAALGCENNIPVISLGEDNPQGQMMYETLLAAKESGRTISIVANKCWGGFSTPQVYSITTY